MIKNTICYMFLHTVKFTATTFYNRNRWLLSYLSIYVPVTILGDNSKEVFTFEVSLFPEKDSKGRGKLYVIEWFTSYVNCFQNIISAKNLNNMFCMHQG